jgi:dipeptidyl aminopeptidase/acylaminoacyl peptidase
MILAALALVAAAQARAAEPVTPKIPINFLSALPLVKSPKLSPDGSLIAAQATIRGEPKIVLFNADNPTGKWRAIPLEKANVSGLTWAGNKKLLLTLRSIGYLTGGYELPLLRLVVVDVATGQSQQVDKKSRGLSGADILYTDPTSSWALISSQDYADKSPSVKRVDLATGEAKIVEKSHEGVWDWYVDEKGVVRAGVAYDEDSWTVWYRDKEGEKLRAVRGKFDKNDNSTIDSFIFRGDNSWIVTNGRTGRFGLYNYDVKTGQIGSAIFEHPQVDIDTVHFDTVTGTVTGVEYEDDRPRVAWLDPDMKKVQAAIDKALPNETNNTIGWSDDDNRVLVWSGGASDPGRYYLFDRKSSQLRQLVDPYPQINPADLAETKFVRYQARDGLTLNAYLTLPSGREPKGLPLVVVPHGGPFARDHWDYNPLVQFLANRGYAVLQPQFRGSTGFGRDLVVRAYGEWGRKMQDDLDDGVDWLARQGQVDAKRVCIIGGSYGGYAAMWAAARNPERYRCAASMAGVSDVPAMLRYDKRAFSAERYYREWRSRIIGEDNDLKAVSPINFADKIKVPMLIAHGEDDDNVPAKQSHEMVEALQKANANVTSVFYEDEGHGFSDPADYEDWLQRLDQFLAKYNPA